MLVDFFWLLPPLVLRARLLGGWEGEEEEESCSDSTREARSLLAAMMPKRCSAARGWCRDGVALGEEKEMMAGCGQKKLSRG